MFTNNTNTTTIVPSLSVVSNPTTAVSDAQNALKAAKEAMEAAKKSICEAVNEILDGTKPDEAVVLAKDLAVKFGVTPAYIGTIICNRATEYGIRPRSVTYIRRMVEVDENGNPIPGAPIVERREDRAGYTKRGQGRW